MVDEAKKLVEEKTKGIHEGERARSPRSVDNTPFHIPIILPKQEFIKEKNRIQVIEIDKH